MLTRRILLASAGSALTITPAAAVCSVAIDHPDAGLVALENQFRVLHAEALAADAAQKPYERLFAPTHEALTRKEITFEDWCRIRRECGFLAAGNRSEAAYEQCNALSRRVRETPAQTIVGLAVKARIAAYDMHFLDKDFLETEDDMDWAPLCMLGLIREIERLAEARI